MRDTSEKRRNEAALEVHPDARRSRLRGILARINSTVPAVTLDAGWHDLMAALDLGPEPVTKTCPSCRAIVMRDATRCGHCWTYLRQ